MKKAPPNTVQKGKDPPWYLTGQELLRLHSRVVGELTEVQKLLQHTFVLRKQTMKAAQNHYPNAKMWIRYRERFFHTMRERFGKMEAKLQAHRAELANVLVKLDEVESALKRGQPMLTPEESQLLKARTQRLKRRLTREQKRMFEAEAARQISKNSVPESDAPTPR